MDRLASLLAVSVLCVGSLSACTGGDDYCDKLEDYDQDASLADADFTTEEGQEKVIDVLADLKGSAPSDLEAEYDNVISGLEAFRDGKAADVDQEQLQADYEAISTNAQDECDVDMG